MLHNDKKQLFNHIYCSFQKEGYVQCSEDVCIPEGYSSSSMPRLSDNSAITSDIPVPVKMIIDSVPMKIMLEFTDVEILEVSDMKHTITIKMHLGVHWDEPRLKSLDTSHKLEDKYSIDIRILDYLWLPDLDIWNIKDIQEYKVLKKLAGMSFKK